LQPAAINITQAEGRALAPMMQCEMAGLAVVEVPTPDRAAHRRFAIQPM
jgi:hypothetical protein